MTNEEKNVLIARDLVARGWSTRGACRAVAERHRIGVVDVETQAAVLATWLTWDGDDDVRDDHRLRMTQHDTHFVHSLIGIGNF